MTKIAPQTEPLAQRERDSSGRRGSLPWHVSVGESNQRCDLLLVDGDHNYQGSRQDILDLWPAAARHSTTTSLLWVDDVVPACHCNRVPSRAARLWSAAVEERHCAQLRSDGVKPESRVNAGPGLAVGGLIEEGVLPLETH